MSDDTQLSSSESTEQNEEDHSEDESLNTGSESDNSESGDQSEDKSAMVPSHRLREETAKRREAEKVSGWYRENIGNPEDVIAFRKWQQEQAQKSREAEPQEEGELSAAQIKAVERLVVRAIPWLKDIDPAVLTDLIASRKVTAEVMYDSATEEIRRLTKEANLPGDKESQERIEYLVGAEINRDQKLMNLWKAGNAQAAVSKAFEKVRTFYGKGNGASAADARTRRSVTKLPTPPSGGSASVGTRSPEKRAKGLDGKAGKEAADQAWALINQES